MDQTRASRVVTGGRLSGVTRHPGFALAAVVATGVLATMQYKRSSLNRNERLQKNSAETPNLYVSVDRSGGGI
ncbi:hypothetical protein F4818DRAFT_437039 [Hypoxylon cercidicola]|nr:hypothetical protein F4818DRAFT_437039 [Hypoxylon cercidicola]